MDTTIKTEVFNYTDSWIANSIYIYRIKGLAFDLESLIGYGDYIDHSIVSYEEFKNSLEKLMRAGAVLEDGKEIYTTDRFNKTFADMPEVFKKKTIAQELVFIKEILNTFFINERSPNIQLQLTEKEFSTAADAYLKR